MTEVAVPETILNPLTGELVPASDVPKVAVALAALREYKGRVLDGIREAEAIVLEASREQGTKTLRFEDGTVAEVSGGSAVEWQDVDGLEQELREAGLPDDRLGEVIRVTVERVVVTGEANRVARANPVYAEIIERHRSRVEKPWRVSVKRT